MLVQDAEILLLTAPHLTTQQDSFKLVKKLE
jgi:hypothetical protein